MNSTDFELLKFLIDNLGAVATILVIIVLFPVGIAICMWRMAVSSQKAINNELQEILESQKELTGLVKGSLSIVKLFLGDKLKEEDSLDGRRKSTDDDKHK